MINKLDKLEALTIKRIEDVESENNYQYDIIEMLKGFKKSDLIEYISILLYTINENKTDYKKGGIYDAFGFWKEEEEAKAIKIYNKDIENYKNNNIELINVINEVFSYNNIILYNFDYGYTDKRYNKKQLKNIIEYIEKTNNIINMIYEEEKTLFINIENYDYYEAGEKK